MIGLPLRRHKPTIKMPQDQKSGTAGNEFGRTNAKKLAGVLGATLTRPGTNEARWRLRFVCFVCSGLPLGYATNSQQRTLRGSSRNGQESSF